MKNIPFITDCIFSFFATFVLSFVVLNYFLAMPYTLIVAIIVSVMALILTASIIKRKQQKEYRTKEQKQLFEHTLFQLNLMKTSELVSYFATVYEKLKTPVVKKRNCLYIESKNKYVFFSFNFSKPNKCDIVKIYNQIPANCKAEIFTENCDADVLDFAKRFKTIEISCAKKVFALIKQSGVFPSLPCPQLENKQKPTVNLKNLLKKEKSKNFFFLGLTFMFMSFIVSKKIYYVVFGGIFLIYSLVLRIYGKDKNQRPDQNG